MMKKCGLYIRVSTEKQAKIEEGSLKNQEHLLTQHVSMKNNLDSERWVAIDRYIDEGRSAKDTNRPAYQRMIEDVKSGRINTVMCLALSRISRSTHDLLEMVEFFKKYNVDFVCLKEDVDTTTPMGRLLLTFMGGLNQFEREQTGERTSAAFLARAERGLWNGGQLLGYDLDPQKKSYLLVNEREAELVRFAFKTYLEVGSVAKTSQILNARGYRSKSYTSRRGKLHPSAKFVHSSVYNLLTNPAYIGKKEINKTKAKRPWCREPNEASGYKVVDAVWEPIIEVELFKEVQKLLRENCKTKNNGSLPTKHFYLLNGGFLYCQKCGTVMGGRNGHGHKNRKPYYYYYCKNQQCRQKYPQKEVERMVGELISRIAQHKSVLTKVVSKLNQKLKKQAPAIYAEKKAKEKELRCVREKAGKLLSTQDWDSQSKVFVDEQLKDLAQKRKHLEEEVVKLGSELNVIEAQALESCEVQNLLQQAGYAIMGALKPYKQKELLKAAVKKFEISDETCAADINLDSAFMQSEWSNEKSALSKASGGAIPKGKDALQAFLPFFFVQNRHFPKQCLPGSKSSRIGY